MLDDKTRRRIKPIKHSAPKFTGSPKIHKQGILIKPLVNFTTAAEFKTSKTLYKIMKSSIRLQNNHSIKKPERFYKSGTKNQNETRIKKGLY